MGGKTRKQVIRALELTYDKVARDLIKQMNAYPLRYRLIIAWRLLWGNLEI